MKKIFYTLGTSHRSESNFIQLLQKYNITLVVDVRSRNGSRVLHFDESRYHNLSRLLCRYGIDYDDSLHIALGGLQNGKMTIGNFRKYAETLAFQRALDALKEKVTKNQRGETLILCCELNPKQCHRYIIGVKAECDGWQVVHLV